jgi:hypothetical protein
MNQTEKKSHNGGFESALLLCPPNNDPRIIEARKRLDDCDHAIKNKIETILKAQNVGVTELIMSACEREEDVAVVASVLPPSVGILTADLKTASEVEICVNVGYTEPDRDPSQKIVKDDGGVSIRIPELAVKCELQPYFAISLPQLSECRAMVKSVCIQNTFNSVLCGHIGIRALVPVHEGLMSGQYESDLAIFKRNMERPAFSRLIDSQPTVANTNPEEKTKDFYGASQADLPALSDARKGVFASLRKVWPLLNPLGTGVDTTCKCLYKNDAMEAMRSGGAELSDFQTLSAWVRTQWPHELQLEFYRFLTCPSESRCIERKSAEGVLTGLAMVPPNAQQASAVVDNDGSFGKAYEWYCTQLPDSKSPTVFAMKDPKDKTRTEYRQNPLAFFAALMAPAIIHSEMQRTDSKPGYYIDSTTSVLRLPRKILYQNIAELVDYHKQVVDTIIPLNDLRLHLIPIENAVIRASDKAEKERGSFNTRVKLRLIMVEPTIPADRLTALTTHSWLKQASAADTVAVSSTSK